MGFGNWLRRLAEVILRRKKRSVSVVDLSPEERSFRQIWRYVKYTSSVRFPPARKRPNVLVFQMGKVASLAIHQALSECGINAFHCHTLSLARQEQALSNLFRSELTFNLTSHELRLHIHNVSLRMLVRWYKMYKQYRGRKLKVITLTRDPVSHYKSSFMQQLDLLLPKIGAWQHDRLGRGIDTSIDQAEAVKDFVLELASIIVAANAHDADACSRLASERWPSHPIVAQEVLHWLRPLTWFDVEIADIFDLDVLAPPDLRERGWVVLQNDWVEILALRFEQLNDLEPKIAEFTGIPALALRHKNVTARKSGAAEFLPAMQAAMDMPIGQACVGALRSSRYTRACGYDQPAQISPAATS